ncbi:MAG: restriction endonuclease subunit S [Flavobacteriales bacterium]|jgi:type I restriction enzyme S subunit
MKSNYKRIGDHIKLVDERNRGLRIKQLLGLSISKQFIPSVANIIGTDMENYKIIRKNQFACSTMQVRRDKKMPVALLQDIDEAIISQAYPVFEVKDVNQLLPEYLMMWFARSEFDREACFHAVGGVRGSLEWEDFENMQLPIPSITKQREIVKEYNTIQKRIELNQQLINKLEETAQAIYKQWFENYSDTWEWITVKEFCVDMKSGGTPSRSDFSFWKSNDIPWLKTGEIKNNIIIQTEEFISNEGLKSSSAKLLPKGTVLMSMYGVNAGEIGILKIEATTNQACCGMICKNQMQAAFLYYHLLHNQKYIATQAIGGAQENLSKDFIEKIEIPLPNDTILNSHILKSIIDNKEVYTRQTQKLIELKDLLLSKLATA